MLAALKESPESGHLVKEARKYLTGVKGTLVQKKKIDMEKRKREEDARLGINVGQGPGSTSYAGLTQSHAHGQPPGFGSGG